MAEDDYHEPEDWDAKKMAQKAQEEAEEKKHLIAKGILPPEVSIWNEYLSTQDPSPFM